MLRYIHAPIDPMSFALLGLISNVDGTIAGVKHAVYSWHPALDHANASFKTLYCSTLNVGILRGRRLSFLRWRLMELSRTMCGHACHRDGAQRRQTIYSL